MTTDTLTLLCVHAHPDDETLGTGGTYARYAAEGLHTALVCATRGEEGEIHDPSVALPPDGDIATLREQELRCAVTILGIRTLRFLGYRDSGMPGAPANQHPAAFAQADLATATRRLALLIREIRPHVLVTYDAHGIYLHPDHLMCHRVTTAAFDLAGDPAWPTPGLDPWQPRKLYYIAIPRSWVQTMRRLAAEHGLRLPNIFRTGRPPEDLATPDDQITTWLDVEPYLEQKRQALLCHRSQIAPSHPLRALPLAALRDLYRYEAFIRARSLVPAPEREEDLFAGLR